MKYLRVKNRNDIVRDSQSGAILSVDRMAYEHRLRQIKLSEQKKQEEHQREVELNTLKEELHSLQQLVHEVLKKDSD